ncbi:MAG: hypothetical protein ACI9LN_002994, partial [Saprospiraceae bacterium]
MFIRYSFFIKNLKKNAPMFEKKLLNNWFFKMRSQNMNFTHIPILFFK